MSFKDQPFNQRWGVLGDEAEGVFESVYPQKFSRFGLNRTEVNLRNVPPFVRFMPDYLTAKGLVEVQGFGRDQKAKFKTSKLDALWEWHDYLRVDFFLWDSKNRRYGWVRMLDLEKALEAHGSQMQFHEGNPYWELRAPQIPVIEWVAHGEPLGAHR